MLELPGVAPDPDDVRFYKRLQGVTTDSFMSAMTIAALRGRLDEVHAAVHSLLPEGLLWVNAGQTAQASALDKPQYKGLLWRGGFKVSITQGSGASVAAQPVQPAQPAQPSQSGDPFVFGSFWRFVVIALALPEQAVFTPSSGASSKLSSGSFDCPMNVDMANDAIDAVGQSTETLEDPRRKALLQTLLVLCHLQCEARMRPDQMDIGSFHVGESSDGESCEFGLRPWRTLLSDTIENAGLDGAIGQVLKAMPAQALTTEIALASNFVRMLLYRGKFQLAGAVLEKCGETGLEVLEDVLCRRNDKRWDQWSQVFVKRGLDEEELALGHLAFIESAMRAMRIDSPGNKDGQSFALSALIGAMRLYSEGEKAIPRTVEALTGLCDRMLCVDPAAGAGGHWITDKAKHPELDAKLTSVLRQALLSQNALLAEKLSLHWKYDPGRANPIQMFRQPFKDEGCDLNDFSRILKTIWSVGVDLNQPLKAHSLVKGKVESREKYFIHCLASCGSKDVILMLHRALIAGLDPNIKDSKGWTVRSFLASDQKKEWDIVLKSFFARKEAMAALGSIDSEAERVARKEAIHGL